MRKTIWEKTGIANHRVRKHVFDYDDFVVNVKNGAAVWARDNIIIDVSIAMVPNSTVLVSNVFRITAFFSESYLAGETEGPMRTTGT